MWKLYFVAIQYIQYVGKFMNKSFVAFCRKVNLPALNTAEERGRGHRGTNVIIRKSIIARGRTKYEREN